ncbi:MAG: hypothetical protein NTV58_09955, partial [Deltaproteobacteria bacterium]|nr:hypothetical protein [Deltaproteobacteria bacterium]
MNYDVRQPIQGAFTPTTNAGKRYKPILKPERGKINTHYVNLFNGSHISLLQPDGNRAVADVPGGVRLGYSRSNDFSEHLFLPHVKFSDL